jgi:hypothetical protein
LPRTILVHCIGRCILPVQIEALFWGSPHRD